MPREERGTKTLAIRLDEQLHAQLSVIAQLAGLSVTDAIRQAIEAYVENQRSQGDLAERAKGVVDDIEREAAARRSAIESLFGSEGSGATEPSTRASGKRPSRARPTETSG